MNNWAQVCKILLIAAIDLNAYLAKLLLQNYEYFLLTFDYNRSYTRNK